MDSRSERDLTINTSALKSANVRVTIGGDLDLATVSPLRSAFAAALSSADVSGLRLDLARVTFFDCATIGVLVRIRNEGAITGTRVTIVAASPIVEQLLILFELTAFFAYTTPTDRPRWRWPTFRHSARSRRSPVSEIASHV